MKKQSSKHTQTNTEKVHQDHCCSICLNVFYKPVQLHNCKHNFCHNCLNQAALITQNYRCPLCRTNFHLNQIHPLLELQNMMTNLYPRTIQEKKKFIKQRVMVRLLIGNTTQEIQTNEDNKYRWSFYVRPAPGDKRLSDSIQRIRVKLHHTFNPNTIVYELKGNQTVNLTRIGWGTFRIQIKVFWKGQYQQKQSDFHHDLQFIPNHERIANNFLTMKN